jgi:hypothetical protein
MALAVSEKRKKINIEISTDTYEQLRDVKDFLEETFDCGVGFDKVLRVMLSPKLIDFSEMLQNEKTKAAEKTL